MNTAGHKNYLQRARTAAGSASLVVVQGGSNDHRHALDDIRTAAVDTYRTLRGRFPGARVLVLGPGPDPQPVDATQTAVDRTLQAAAESLGLVYVSMLQRDWVPDHNTGLVIDPDNHHPTVSGQAYLGLRLAAATRLLHPELFAASEASA